MIALSLVLHTLWDDREPRESKSVNTSKPPSSSKEAKKESIQDLKKLRVIAPVLKRDLETIDQSPKTKKLGEQKTSFKILPGTEILNQYEKNEGDIKKTINDFKDNPSLEAEVTIPF